MREPNRRDFLCMSAAATGNSLWEASHGLKQLPEWCRVSGQISRYRGAHWLRSLPFAFARPAGTEMLPDEGVKWRCDWKATAVSGRSDALDIEIRCRLTEGISAETSVDFTLTWDDWSKANYVLLPGAAYNGNRFESRRIPYPPMLQDPVDWGPDSPTIINDIPRLNLHDGPSRIQLLSGDMSTPAIGVYAPGSKTGVWLLTLQGTRLGDSGLAIEEGPNRRQAVLTVCAPCVRRDSYYHRFTVQNPSPDRGAEFRAGDELRLRVRLYFFHCESPQKLFDKFAGIRKDLTGPVHLMHEIPFSCAWAIQEEKYNRDNWVEREGYYTVAPAGEKEDRPWNDWQTGWIGGMMVTHALLFEGSAESRARALRNFEFFFAHMPAKSGFFHGCWHNGVPYQDGFLFPHSRNWHLLRKSSDALFFLIKQFRLLEEQDASWRLPERWASGAIGCADAFVRMWRKYGQLGQFADIESGDITVGGSTCASTAPAGLALAAGYFGRLEYLEVADAAARLYYARDVRAGVTTGGPGEILQAPDQESLYGLLESFMVLYEITGERHWVDKASELAYQFASWFVSYDFEFPPTSTFGKLGIRTAGSLYASAQNKCSTPGICTGSGLALLKLFRATGNPLFLELLGEVAHNLPQYLSRADRPVGKMPPGWMNERVEMNDWLEPRGEIFNGSCWCEVSAMLTYIEIPGVYVQPDRGFLWSCDHVGARIEVSGKGGGRLLISNPTRMAAKVKVLIESSEQTSKVLGQNPLWGCRTVAVAPGATVGVPL